MRSRNRLRAARLTLIALILGGAVGAADGGEFARRLREWRGIEPSQSTAEEVARALGSPGEILEGATCEGVTGVEVRAYEGSGGDPLAVVCFRGGRVLIVRQLLAEISAPEPESTPAFNEKALGAPALELPSHQGKAFSHLVWPAAGIAIDADSEIVTARHLFAPTTTPAYEADLYADPPDFVR
jgi:hypothetical protein